jgi:hypothetical protein
MTSVLRGPKLLERKTKVEALTTLCYFDDTTDIYIPFPFTVNAQGVLDIANTNSSINGVIANGNWYYGSYQLAKEMGGAAVPSSLGPNILTWLSNIYTPFESATIAHPGLLTRVQTVGHRQNDNQFQDPFYAATGGSDNFGTPSQAGVSSDEFAWGRSEDNYNTAWIFKNPTVLEIKADGLTTTLILASHFDAAGFAYALYD